MSKKTRMGRNLNALLGGSTRTRESVNATPGTDTKDASAAVAERAAPSQDVASSPSSADSNETSPNSGLSSGDQKPEGATTGNVQEAAVASNPAVELSERAQVQAPKVAPEAEQSLQTGDKLRLLGVDQISRGTYQPRRHFDQTLLQELADSLKAQGLIQPILVRPYGGAFELIAGERRWRAAQLAGISEIPAIVRDLDDQSVAAVSLIENIQRADLNPLEEATALERLCEEFSMTHQAVAEAVGRSRTSVTNLMRLLELDEEVKMLVDEGKIDMGHARALLGAPSAEQATIARRIVSQGMTVRAVEKLVKDIREGKTSDGSVKKAAPDPNIEALRRKLGDILGAPVAVKHSKNGSGKLEITYTSVDELEGILRHIK